MGDLVGVADGSGDGRFGVVFGLFLDADGGCGWVLLGGVGVDWSTDDNDARFEFEVFPL